MLNICQWYDKDLLKLCQIYVKNMPKICQRYAEDMPKTQRLFCCAIAYYQASAENLKKIINR